jgi:hypothetical protein
MKSSGPVSSDLALNAAFRVELHGLLHRVCTYTTTTKGEVTLFCDSKGVIQSAYHKYHTGISQCLQSDFDIIHLIRMTLQRLHIKLSIKWVKGHSTSATKSFQEILNGIADDLATSYARNPHHRFRPGAIVAN